MKKILLFLILSFYFYDFAFSQSTFHHIYAEDFAIAEGARIINTSDGGHIIVGTVHALTLSQFDNYILKLDKNGIEEWNVTHDFDQGFYGEIPRSIVEIEDGYLIITDTWIINESSDAHHVIFKIDKQGQFLWRKNFFDFKDLKLYQMISSNDNNLFLLGYGKNEISDDTELLLMKMDLEGNEVWKRYFDFNVNGGGEAHNLDLLQKENGNIIIGAGGNDISTSFPLNDKTCIILETDQSGNLLWFTEFKNTFPASSIAAVSDGYIFSTDFIQPYTMGEEGHAVVFKLDSEGNFIWKKYYEDHISYDIPELVTNDDEIVFVGKDASDHLAIIKTNQSGEILWKRGLVPLLPYIGYVPLDLKLTEDGGYIMIGYVIGDNPGAGSQGIFVVRLDKNGEFGEIMSTSNKAIHSSIATKIFPNPAAESLQIELAKYSEEIQFNVFSLNGVLIRTEKATSIINSIDIKSLPTGSYILEVRNSNKNQYYRSLFVKE